MAEGLALSVGTSSGVEATGVLIQDEALEG